MNKHAYKSINTLKTSLLELDLERRVKLSELQDIFDMAQDDFDGHSERWQESDVGLEEQERLDELNQAIQSLTEAVQLIESAISNIETIENNAPEGSFN